MATHFGMIHRAMEQVERRMDFTFYPSFRLDRRQSGNVLMHGFGGHRVDFRNGRDNEPLAIIDEPATITKSMASTVAIQFMTSDGKLSTRATTKAASAFVEELEVLRVDSSAVPMQEDPGSLVSFVPYTTPADPSKLDILVDGSRVLLRGDFGVESRAGWPFDSFGRRMVDDGRDLDDLELSGVANLSREQRYAYSMLAPLREVH